MRWFGQPWPSAEERAPICEDDEFKIPVPPVPCLACEEPIEVDERGIVTGASLGIAPGFWLTIEKDGEWEQAGRHWAVAYHIDCWIRQILPDMRGLISRKA